MTARSVELCGFSELLEPDSQPVPVRTILNSPRQLNRCSGDALEAEFEKPATMDFEQPIRDMDAEIRIDADQMGEGGMMELRQR
jgi:hypothetical protein